MARARSRWNLFGRRVRLSPPGRVLFAGVLVVGVAASAVARAHGAREGGAPLVALALALAGVLVVDAAGRGVVALVRRRRP